MVLPLVDLLAFSILAVLRFRSQFATSDGHSAGRKAAERERCIEGESSCGVGGRPKIPSIKVDPE